MGLVYGPQWFWAGLEMAHGFVYCPIKLFFFLNKKKIFYRILWGYFSHLKNLN